MLLSKKLLASLPAQKISVPSFQVTELPEKVLQFGTGVLLRGLPDFYIDKANRQGIFNGRIVVIKSTARGDAAAFEEQDGLYTQCIRGIKDGTEVEEFIINASVSRVLTASDHWHEILQCAADPHIEIVISNTTEVGIVLNASDRIDNCVPGSFPGKLLALLYKRYRHFDGDEGKGFVIIPTELIIDNGDKLREIVIELAHLNQLDEQFINWVSAANTFCNSLVDRIVPGKLPVERYKEATALLGYEDELMIMSEVYSLWAIEPATESVKAALSFAGCDGSVVITGDIEKFRELKLRLLNGTHTFSCGIALLAGFVFVKDAMQHQSMHRYISGIMKQEIAGCITNGDISAHEADAFAGSVTERFANPFIDHKWISITLNYTQKMKLRNIPVLLEFYKRFNTVPVRMAMGFAAYILFMKCSKQDDGNYGGTLNGNTYEVQDEQAAYFCQLWQDNNSEAVVAAVLANTALWGTDISALPGFEKAVSEWLAIAVRDGMQQALELL